MEIYSQQIVDNIKHEPEEHYMLIMPAHPEKTPTDVVHQGNARNPQIYLIAFDRNWKNPAKLFERYFVCGNCDFVTKCSKELKGHGPKCDETKFIHKSSCQCTGCSKNFELFLQKNSTEIFHDGCFQLGCYMLNENGTYTRKEIDFDVQYRNEKKRISPETDTILLANSRITYEAEMDDGISVEPASFSSLTPQSDIRFYSSVGTNHTPVRRRGRPRKSQRDWEAELARCTDNRRLKRIKNNVCSAKCRDGRKTRIQKLEIEMTELKEKNKALKCEYISDKIEVRELKNKILLSRRNQWRLISSEIVTS